MATDETVTRHLTRRLIAQAAGQSDAEDDAVHAAHGAFERTYQVLARSLGPAAAHELLTRAFKQTRHAHPALSDIRIDRLPEPLLGGVPELVQAHGARAVAAGLEAALEGVLGLLARLIGDDLVPRLVEQNSPAAPHRDEDDA